MKFTSVVRQTIAYNSSKGQTDTQRKKTLIIKTNQLTERGTYSTILLKHSKNTALNPFTADPVKALHFVIQV